MKWRSRIVIHNPHLFLPNHVAAEIFLEFDSVLQGHAQVASLVVVIKEFLGRVHFVNVLPSSTRIRLQESREADILKNLIPIQWINQIPNGLTRRALGMLVVRK